MLNSGIWKKVIMALTGLFLCTFLIVHMIGNMQLLVNDNGAMFNSYAYAMTHNPLIKFVSYFTYAGFLFHIIDGIVLSLQNRNARPIGYAYQKAGKSASWASRNMIALGLIIFFFLIAHLGQFWFQYKFGEIPLEAGQPYKNLYLVVTQAFQQWWIVLLYLISLVALYFHLAHGFQSAFQTIGFRHPYYFKIITGVGNAYSILIPLGFAIQPIVVFLRSNGII